MESRYGSRGSEVAESMRGAEILDALYLIIRERQESAAPDSSYTASLMAKGIDKILKKVGEEATELVIAAKGEARHEVVYEAADLLYHVLVLLAFQNISPVEVYSELARRFGMSGLEEKASRTPGK